MVVVDAWGLELLLVLDYKEVGLVNKVTKMELMVVDDKEEMLVNKVTEISSKPKL